MSLDVNKMTKDQLRQHILMLAMQLTQLEKENKTVKEYWNIEIKTCNRYREKSDKLEQENKRISKQRDTLSRVNDRVMEENNYLELENKKLKAELELKNLALKQAQE